MPCNSGWVCQYSSSINSNSCARPKAKTGIKHEPPRVTMSSTVAVNRASRSSVEGNVMTGQ